MFSKMCYINHYCDHLKASDSNSTLCYVTTGKYSLHSSDYIIQYKIKTRRKREIKTIIDT